MPQLCKSCHFRQQCLSKVQGSKEKQASRIRNTMSEFRTQLTPQFAKSNSGVPAPLEAGCCGAAV